MLGLRDVSNCSRAPWLFGGYLRDLIPATALASGSLFFLRGALLFSGQGWALAAPVRWLAWTIDTVLLTAALMLTTIGRQYPFVHGWLTVKVALLAVYIALGVVAFWKARTLAVRVSAWVAALLVFGYIYSVARAHDPLGFFALTELQSQSTSISEGPQVRERQALRLLACG